MREALTRTLPLWTMAWWVTPCVVDTHQANEKRGLQVDKDLVKGDSPKWRLCLKVVKGLSQLAINLTWNGVDPG